MADLTETRAAFAKEYDDPGVRNALLSLTHAEVGGQGPQAHQAFMESVANRAAARGKSLSDTIYDRNYYPAVTHQRMRGGIPAGMADHYGGILDQVRNGSNVSNFATGNASGTVGFAGGPQTHAVAGERFGVEGPDRKWVQRMNAGVLPAAGPSQPQPSQASPMPSLAFDPAADQQPSGNFFDRLSSTMQSPLFMMGAGVMGGKTIGGGLMEGAEAAQSAAKSRMLQEEFARKQQGQARFQKLLQDNPQMFGSLSPDLKAIALATRDPSVLTQMLIKHPDMELDRKFKTAQIDNLNRREEPDIVRTLRAGGIDPRSPQGQLLIQQSIKGNSPIDQVVAEAMQAARQPPASGGPVIGQQPHAVPQSFNQGDSGAERPQFAFGMPNLQQGGATPPGAALGPSDPNLIRTQSAASPQPSSAAGGQDELVQVPGFPNPMTRKLAETLQFGLAKDRGQVIGDALKKADIGKETRNKIDDQELKAVNGLGRMRQIVSGFKPGYLTYEEKAKQYGISWLDSFETLRNKLSPEDLQKHAEYIAWQRDAFENLTETIRDATGAAMGVQEEKRIRKGAPDPEKDGPTQFMAKAEGTMRALELSMARTQYLRNTGRFTGDGHAAEKAMPVDQFKKQINTDSENLYRQLKAENPTAPEADLIKGVRQKIRAGYGVNI